MLPFSTLILRSYYEAIGWNQDNSYTQLNRSSDGMITLASSSCPLQLTSQLLCESLSRDIMAPADISSDFQIPRSLILQLANAPTPIFFTSYSLDALPQLNGSLSYITTSEALDRVRQ